MNKYSEIKGTKNFDQVPFIPNEKVNWLWINDYFDGPIEGIVEVESMLLLCSMAEEVEDETKENWFRKYWLVELTSEQIEIEQYWHEEFCKYVGTHFTCDDGGKRRSGDIPQPREQWDKFYEPYKANYNANFDDNNVIGWCCI